MSNIYYWEKLTFSKLRFSRKENLKKCTSFEEQKIASYIRRNVYIGIIIFSCISSTKPCLRFLLNCFVQELKGCFADEGAMIKTTLMSSFHWKTLVLFCLQKKRPENALLTLTVNYRKTVQKNKLCHSKQQ